LKEKGGTGMNPYDFAIQMSRDGEKFFRTLTRQVKKPRLRKILAILATDQATHRHDFVKMKKVEGKFLPEAKNLTGAINPFAQRLKRLDLGEKLDENLPPTELYRRGQALDRECEDFYRKKAARVKDSRLKQAFLGVAEEQRKHHVTLEHLINFILEPEQELEDAEWNIPEPLE
jgi:rubrerythrin